MSDLDAAGKAYARFVLKEMGLTPSALAKGAGLATTTLTRALNDPGHQFNLSTTTINKIAQFSKISPAPFFEAKDFAEMALAPHTREDFYIGSPLGRLRVSQEMTPMNMTYVIGDAAVGVWKNPEITGSLEAEALWLTLPNSKASEVFALKMADDSAAPFVRKDEFVICRRPFHDDEKPTHGELSVIERRMNGLIEITLRRAVFPDTGAPYFQFDSKDPRHIERLNIGGREHRVIGVALYAVRSTDDLVLKLQREKREEEDPFPA